MLHTSVVPIDRQPVIECFPVGQAGIIMRIAVTHIVPARASPVGHRIYLAFRRSTALGAGGMYPVGCTGESR